MELVDALLGRTRRGLGGHLVAGRALMAGDNRVSEGTLIFFGPEVFFAASGGTAAGVLRVRAGAPFPVVHVLPDWKAPQAATLIAGQEGMLPGDPTGGRALAGARRKGRFSITCTKAGSWRI